MISANPYASVAALRIENDFIRGGRVLFGKNKEVRRSVAVMKSKATGQVRLVDSACRSDVPISSGKQLVELFITDDATSFDRKTGHWFYTHYLP